MPTLRALFFDIDDTLFSTTWFARRARRNAVRAMIETGLDHSEASVLAELDEVIAEFSSNYGQHFDKLLTRLGGRRVAGVNDALIVAAGVAAYHDTKFRELSPFDDVIPLLQDLGKTDLRLGIITHGRTAKQAEKMVRLGLVPHVDADAVFISEQIGISKPNPKLYLAALNGLGLRPEEAMYVGDNPRHDIVPAQSLGMVAVYASRSSKYALGDIVPDHVIDDFGALRRLLREVYEVAV